MIIPKLRRRNAAKSSVLKTQTRWQSAISGRAQSSGSQKGLSWIHGQSYGAGKRRNRLCQGLRHAGNRRNPAAHKAPGAQRASLGFADKTPAPAIGEIVCVEGSDPPAIDEIVCVEGSDTPAIGEIRSRTKLRERRNASLGFADKATGAKRASLGSRTKLRRRKTAKSSVLWSPTRRQSTKSSVCACHGPRDRAGSLSKPPRRSIPGRDSRACSKMSPSLTRSWKISRPAAGKTTGREPLRLDTDHAALFQRRHPHLASHETSTNCDLR